MLTSTLLLTKRCGKCKTEKVLAEFAVERRQKGGRHGWCRVCHNIYIAERRKQFNAELRAAYTEAFLPQEPTISKRAQFRPVTATLTESDAAYTAGILDGEGTISIALASEPTVYLKIGNTSLHLMAWLYERIGGGYGPSSQRGTTFVGTKQMYAWFLGGKAAVALIRRVAPFLTIKRSHVQVIEEFLAAKARKDRKVIAVSILKIRGLNSWGRRWSPRTKASK